MRTIRNIIPAPSSHIAEDEVYGDGDGRYRISFRVNDVFREAKSHAGEVEMLHTCAPGEEYGREGSFPYLAVQFDDAVFDAVEEYKESGTVTGASEITALSEPFYFRAKMEYFGDVMYFYAMDCCDGSWENVGLCMVYPEAYVGTEDERTLMRVLDEAAESYREVRI